MEYSREQLIERLQTNLDAWHTENAVVLMPIEPKPDKPCLRDIVAELRRTESSECRVMTLEEVLVTEVVYVEDIDKNEIIPVLVDRRAHDCIVLVRARLMGSPSLTIYPLISEYGKRWRCWTQRPTDKQREATPWN